MQSANKQLRRKEWAVKIYEMLEDWDQNRTIGFKDLEVLLHSLGINMDTMKPTNESTKGRLQKSTYKKLATAKLINIFPLFCCEKSVTIHDNRLLTAYTEKRQTNSDRINLEEVMALIAVPDQLVSPEAELLEAFYLLDRQKSGSLSFTRLRTLLDNCNSRFTDRQFKRIIRKKEINKRAGKFDYATTTQRIDERLRGKKYNLKQFDLALQEQKKRNLEEFLRQLMLFTSGNVKDALKK